MKSVAGLLITTTVAFAYIIAAEFEGYQHIFIIFTHFYFYLVNSLLKYTRKLPLKSVKKHRKYHHHQSIYLISKQ
jgi:hypothetical protein